MLGCRWAARVFFGGVFLVLLSWFFLCPFSLGRWASCPLRCAYRELSRAAVAAERAHRDYEFLQPKKQRAKAARSAEAAAAAKLAAAATQVEASRQRMSGGGEDAEPEPNAADETSWTHWMTKSH